MGDVVVATDPVAGVSSPRRVTAAIEGDGIKYLVGISVDGSDDVVTAADLTIGAQLIDDNGVTRRVGSVKAWTSLDHQVHNLTVEGVRTYHVGQDSTLVHNCAFGRAAPRHGGEAVEGGYRFPSRRAAKQAASEAVGDLGSSPKVLRFPRDWKVLCLGI